MFFYSILPPLGFSATGPRPQNEDSVFPPPGQATATDRLFMVCDGVGGAQKGELASATTVEELSNYVLGQSVPVPLPDDWLQEGLQAVESRFSELFAQQFLLKGMATTLTLLLLHQGGAAVAHVGDSRVYQVRAGAVLFQTADHSVVGQLVRTGELAPEEAAAHPKKNVITRAVQGSYEPAQLEIVQLTDIQPGDYFFLCSDGVWECLPDAELAGWLGNPNWTNEEKLQRITARCEEAARDNYSGYLVQLGEAIADQLAPSHPVATAAVAVTSPPATPSPTLAEPNVAPAYIPVLPAPSMAQQPGSGPPRVMWLALLGVSGLLGFWGWSHFHASPSAASPPAAHHPPAVHSRPAPGSDTRASASAAATQLPPARQLEQPVTPAASNGKREAIARRLAPVTKKAFEDRYLPTSDLQSPAAVDLETETSQKKPLLPKTTQAAPLSTRLKAIRVGGQDSVPRVHQASPKPTSIPDSISHTGEQP